MDYICSMCGLCMKVPLVCLSLWVSVCVCAARDAREISEKQWEI